MEPCEIVERYLGEGFEADLVSSPELWQRTMHLRDAFSDLEVEVVALISEGARVAAHFIARGTHHGVYHGVPSTGRQCEAHCTAIYRVADGRIAEAWMTWDSLALLEQLGAVERVETVSA